MLTLDTPRLHLRPWTPDDYAPFRALNADPDVMRFFPACLSAAESDAMADEIIRRFERQKAFGLWVAEEKSSRELPGLLVLISRPRRLISVRVLKSAGVWRNAFTVKVMQPKRQTRCCTMPL